MRMLKSKGDKMDPCGTPQCCLKDGDEMLPSVQKK